jgi:multidrug efflux pump
MEDRSQFFLSVSAPEGTSFQAMDAYIDRLNQFMMDSIPERQFVLSVTSPGFMGTGASNTGFVRVSLIDPKLRDGRRMKLCKW